MRSTYSVSVDDRDVQRAVRHALMMLGARGSVGLMGAIAAAMKRSTLDKFRASGDADHDWPPLSPRTVASRRDVRKARERWRKAKRAETRARRYEALLSAAGAVKPLIDSGRLMQSIAYSYDANSATIGTDLYYGVFHQLGAPRANIPARSFLTIDSNDRRRLMGLIDRYMERVLTS